MVGRIILVGLQVLTIEVSILRSNRVLNNGTVVLNGHPVQAHLAQEDQLVDQDQDNGTIDIRNKASQGPIHQTSRYFVTSLVSLAHI